MTRRPPPRGRPRRHVTEIILRLKKIALYRNDWLIIGEAPGTARDGYSRNSARAGAT